MRKIDATKIGDADLAQCILRDYLVGELAAILSDLNSYSSRGLALASPTLHSHIDEMRDRNALTTRSAKQAHALDTRLESVDFHSTLTSELSLLVDRLEREQHSTLVHASEYQRAERKTAQSAQPFATCAEAR